MNQGGVVGVNGLLIAHGQAKAWTKELEPRSVTLKPLHRDLVDEVWKDQPSRPGTSSRHEGWNSSRPFPFMELCPWGTRTRAIGMFPSSKADVWCSLYHLHPQRPLCARMPWSTRAGPSRTSCSTSAARYIHIILAVVWRSHSPLASLNYAST